MRRMGGGSTQTQKTKEQQQQKTNTIPRKLCMKSAKSVQNYI